MLSLKNKKNIKKVLSIKFENILLIFNLLFFTYCMIYHIALNGIDITNILIEMLVYYSLSFTLSYSIKNVRKDLKERL